MYEHRSQPLLSPPQFRRRLLVHLLGAFGVILGSLVVGTLGYHAVGKLPWIDSFLNAAMLLAGMGPIGELTTDSGKIFAAGFALYAGVLLIGVTTIILAPVLHRILHTVHLESDVEDAGAKG